MARYKVKAFTRKDGTKVRSHYRSKPKLSTSERRRRATKAKTELLPAAVEAAGQRGFRGTLAKLKGKKGIKSPKKLAGWLKGQAKKRGVLSPKHPYVGRRKKGS